MRGYVTPSSTSRSTDLPSGRTPDCRIIASGLPHNWLMIDSLRLPHHYCMIASRLTHSDCLIIAAWLPHDCRMIGSQSPHYCRSLDRNLSAPTPPTTDRVRVRGNTTEKFAWTPVVPTEDADVVSARRDVVFVVFVLIFLLFIYLFFVGFVLVCSFILGVLGFVVLPSACFVVLFILFFDFFFVDYSYLV